MHDQMEMVKEGKKQLVEWFLIHVIGEKARIQVSAEPYERSEEERHTETDSVRGC